MAANPLFLQAIFLLQGPKIGKNSSGFTLMSNLKKNLGIPAGIAMTVTTFIGPGILMLPAMSVDRAGDLALTTWWLTLLLVMPIALVFAMLGARYPSAGGAAHYVKAALNAPLGKAVGWLFLSVLLVGPTVALKVGASYLALALGLPPESILWLTLLTLVAVLMLGNAGIEASAGIQIAIVLALIIAVSWLSLRGAPSAVGFRIPATQQDWLLSLSTVGIVFWCFMGIEVMAHMGAEFRRPQRDFPIALLIGLAIVVACYLATVMLIRQYQVYGDELTNSQSFGLLVVEILGAGWSRAFAIGAFAIVFANALIYLLGFARMILSLSQSGALPVWCGHTNLKGAPANALRICIVICCTSIALMEVLALPVDHMIEMTNGVFITVYGLACFAAWRLTRGIGRWLSAIACASCLLIMLKIGVAMLYPALMLAAACLIETLRYRRSLSMPV